MKFSQAVLLLALGLLVSLPQEMKSDPDHRHGAIRGGGIRGGGLRGPVRLPGRVLGGGPRGPVRLPGGGGLRGPVRLPGGGGLRGPGRLPGGVLGGGGGVFGGRVPGGGMIGGGGGMIGGGMIGAGQGGGLFGGFLGGGASQQNQQGGSSGIWSMGGSYGGGRPGRGGAGGGGAGRGGAGRGGAGGGAAGGGAAGGGGHRGGFLQGAVLGQLPSSRGSANIMYPYGPREGDRITPNVDDGAVQVPLSLEFIFFNKKHRSIFVNNNGVVSFGVAVSKYTPDAFPITDGSAFVAPYWADVNTILGGKVYFRESTKPDLLKRVSDDVNRYFPNINYRAKWAFIATWDRVAYFGSLSKRTNTFQAVLTTNGQRSYIILNYDHIEWTTGAASKGNRYTGQGGITAQAGFNSGDSKHYFNIPGSRTPEIINIAATSNVNVLGRWVFRVDNFSVPGGCVAGVNFAKFGDIFWKDDACEQRCTCKPDGETECRTNECSMSQVCKPTKWFFVCQSPDSCM